MLVYNDIYEYIINFVDEEDIMNMLSANQTFYSKKILLRVMQKRFPVLSTFRKEETWREFYIKMLFSIVELKKLGIPYIAHPSFNPYEIISSGNFRYSTWLSYSVECGDKVNMNLFLQKTKYYHRALKSSVKIGDLDLVRFFIEKGADVNYAFSEAVKNGKFVDLFLIQGANHFDSGLLGAIKGRNIDLVIKMTDKGAKNFREALELALKTNQKNIIDLLLPKVIFLEKFDLFLYLNAAAEGGNLEMVDFMISKGAKNYNRAIRKALKHDQLDVVNLLLKQDKLSYRYILETAVKKRNFDLINLCLEKNARVGEAHLHKAIKYGHLDILKMLMKYKSTNPDELATFMYIASRYGQLKIIEFFFSQMESKHIYTCVQSAVFKGHIEIVKYFIAQGYNNYDEILSGGYMHFDIIKLGIQGGAKNFDQISIPNKQKYFISAIKKSFLNKDDNCIRD